MLFLSFVVVLLLLVLCHVHCILVIAVGQPREANWRLGATTMYMQGFTWTALAADQPSCCVWCTFRSVVFPVLVNLMFVVVAVVVALGDVLLFVVVAVVVVAVVVVLRSLLTVVAAAAAVVGLVAGGGEAAAAAWGFCGG